MFEVFPIPEQNAEGRYRSTYFVPGYATEDLPQRRKFVASVRAIRSPSKLSPRILTIRGRCASTRWFEVSISDSCRAISARTCTRSCRQPANRRRFVCSASTRLRRRHSFACSAPWIRHGPRGFVRSPAPTSKHSTHSSPQGARRIARRASRFHSCDDCAVGVPVRADLMTCSPEVWTTVHYVCHQRWSKRVFSCHPVSPRGVGTS
jgi:hypothetical protein